MSLPYYKRYPTDFLTATVGLTLMEKGAYSILLDLMYARDGVVPDDKRFIAGVLGCSLQAWTKIKTRLVDTGKIVVFLADPDDKKSGVISNKRAEKELESRRKYSNQQAENRTGSNKNNDVEEPSSNHTDTDIDTEIVRERDARESELAFLEADCRKWANGSLVEAEQIPGLDLIDRLMRPEGGEPCSRDDVRAGVSNTAARHHTKGGPKLRSFVAFESAILQARDERLSKNPIVEVIDERAGQSQSGGRGRYAQGGRGAGPRSQHRGNGILAGFALLESLSEAQADVPHGPEDGRVERVA